MLILGGLIIIIIAGIVLMGINEELGIISITIGVLILIFALILLPIARIDCNAGIAAFNATRDTVQEARANTDISYAELAALQHKIIEQNQWLASIQYWNRTVFDIWVPDRVELMTPLR